MTDPEPCIDEALLNVKNVLSRTSEFDALTSLSNAIQFNLSAAPIEKTIISFDANVILRLSNHARSVDIIDYLRANFSGRLILPGQVVQEFWNNQFVVVQTKSTDIKSKFDDLRKLIDGVDSRFEDFSNRFESLLDEFNSSFGYIFHDRTVGKTQSVIQLLEEKAIVPFVPRELFLDIASVRKKTKTPPGFKDDLHGDFFVWADLLFGLEKIKATVPDLERVILVTLDRKIDWSRDGIPHPILTSEIKEICGASFETITIDTLATRLLT